MKKIVSFVLIVCFMLGVGTTSAMAADSKLQKTDLELICQGDKFGWGSEDKNQKIYSKNNNTLVPLRFIVESLDCTVMYDNSGKIAIKTNQNQILMDEPEAYEKFNISLKNNIVELKIEIGKKAAWVNGKKVNMPVEPIIINGSTYVPVRFLAEYLGYHVYYHTDKYGNKTIYVEAVQLIDLKKEKELYQNGKYEQYIEAYTFDSDERVLIKGSGFSNEMQFYKYYTETGDFDIDSVYLLKEGEKTSKGLGLGDTVYDMVSLYGITDRAYIEESKVVYIYFPVGYQPSTETNLGLVVTVNNKGIITEIYTEFW